MEKHLFLQTCKTDFRVKPFRADLLSFMIFEDSTTKYSTWSDAVPYKVVSFSNYSTCIPKRNKGHLVFLLVLSSQYTYIFLSNPSRVQSEHL